MLLRLLGLPHSESKINLNKELDDFFNSDSTSKTLNTDFTMKDFVNIRDAISKGIDQDKFNKELEKLEPEAQEALAIKISQQYSTLKDSIPTNLSVDLFRIDEREPSDFEKSKFLRSVRVLQDPAHILDLMNTGLLTGTEVDALNLYHPEFTEQLKQAIVEKITELKGEDVKLNRNKNYILSSILGVPRVNPTALERFQSEYKAQEATGTKGIDTPAAEQTEIQRVSQES